MRWKHTPRCSHVGTSRPGLSSQQGEVRQGVGPVQPALLPLLLHLLPAVHVDPGGGADGDGDPGRGGSLPPSPLEAVSLATNQLDRAGHPDSPLLSPPASEQGCWSTLRTQVWIAPRGRDDEGRRLQWWNLERRKFFCLSIYSGSYIAWQITIQKSDRAMKVS